MNFLTLNQGWNDLNQLIKISDLNRDLNQMIFLPKKSFDLNLDQNFNCYFHYNLIMPNTGCAVQ